MTITPRQYQLEAIEWLQTPRVSTHSDQSIHDCCRALLYDAPGAGKTPQSAWAMNQLIPTNQSIAVIAPAFLVNQWFLALQELFPQDEVISLEGPSKHKDIQYPARWYIISVQSLRQEKWFQQITDLFNIRNIKGCIVDESHYVKTPDALQSKAVRELTDPSITPHVFLLTATPITKEADDLQHQLRIINPHNPNFRYPHNFLNKYCYFNWTSYGASNIILRKSSKQELEAQRDPITNKLIPTSGYMLGRSYEQIGLELPPLISPDPVIHDMPKDRRRVYDDIKHMWYARLQDDSASLTATNAMEVRHLLCRLTNSPTKQKSLSDYFDVDQGPYLIGCMYKIAAHELQDYIKHTHPELNPKVIVGSETEPAERERIARQSTNPNDVIIATIKSITEGVDLSHCNTVYFYEENWTPGSMYQFLSRVRRHRNSNSTITLTPDISGFTHLSLPENRNTQPVILRYFHARNTIDVRIHQVRHDRTVNIRDLIKTELIS